MAKPLVLIFCLPYVEVNNFILIQEERMWHN